MREIGCDESGYEGAKLVGGETDVFAHAGTGLGVDAAAALVSELRDRIRSPAQEYGAGGTRPTTCCARSTARPSTGCSGRRRRCTVPCTST